MRLIDADKLAEEGFQLIKIDYEREDFKILNLSDIPTAYDLDKVIEQIEKEKIPFPDCLMERGFNAMVRIAKDIVKDGGA